MIDVFPGCLRVVWRTLWCTASRALRGNAVDYSGVVPGWVPTPLIRSDREMSMDDINDVMEFVFRSAAEDWQLYVISDVGGILGMYHPRTGKLFYFCQSSYSGQLLFVYDRRNETNSRMFVNNVFHRFDIGGPFCGKLISMFPRAVGVFFMPHRFCFEESMASGAGTPIGDNFPP